MGLVTEDTFRCRRNDFYHRYKAAKKSAPLSQVIGPNLIKHIEDEIAVHPSIECRSGCSYCCNLRVVAYPFEVVAIYFHLVIKLKNDEFNKCKSLVKEKYSQIADMTMHEHFTTNIQCPFLVDKKCIVYPVRPLSCAGYHSASVNICRESDEKPEILNGGIPLFRSVEEEKSVQHAVVTETLSAFNDDTNQYELIKGLWQVMSDPKLIQRWKAGRTMLSDPG